jgi:hypothetical protein
MLTVAASGFSAGGASSANNTDPYFQTIFPAPLYETPGAPGKNWVQVEASQDANHVLTWRMNGNLIAQRPNTSFTNGTVMVGYMDLFSSIAAPAADAFILFDNVRVEIASAVSAPMITSHPQNRSVYPEQEVTLSVAVTGGAPLAFQWQFNGENIPGATSHTFTLPNVQGENVGFYAVLVTNPGGYALSSNALVSLLDSPYISSVQAAPGESSALISWTTTVAANSQVQFDPAAVVLPGTTAMSAAQSSFGSSSYVDPTLTTQHVILLTGLMPSTRYSFQAISTAGTNSYVSGAYQFTTAGTLVIDNVNATLTGSWTSGTTSADKYSSDYVFATSVAGTPTATATFRPNLTTPGKYDIYAWYPQGGNRADNTPYTIVYDGGTVTVPVNQQSGGGDWRLLAGGLDFARGTNGYVRVANNANPSLVIADAVRFVYVGSQDFPSGQTAPDWWLDFYFAAPSNPVLDPDGDGYTTAQEYVIGTSPTNAASRLQFAGQNGTNSATVTFWPLLGDRTYQLLYRPQIGTPNWQVISPASLSSTADGSGVFVLSLTNAPQNYYRLKVLMSTNAAFSGSFAIPAGKSYSAYASDPVCGPNRAYVR